MSQYHNLYGGMSPIWRDVTRMEGCHPYGGMSPIWRDVTHMEGFVPFVLFVFISGTKYISKGHPYSNYWIEITGTHTKFNL